MQPTLPEGSRKAFGEAADAAGTRRSALASATNEELNRTGAA